MSSLRLQALLFCSDEKIVRVLRRVLSDLEIVLDHCTESDAAIHKLTRQRYEAIIVDCSNPLAASQVLRSARTAPCNKRAVAVAILDSQETTNGAYDLGAHFVLYKPLASERAKTSFRAVRALMKRERRRNTRIPVEIPVVLTSKSGGQQRIATSDLSEGGAAVRPAPSKSSGPTTISLTLPGSGYKIECVVEVAWTNSTQQAGIRFIDLSPDACTHLKAWLESHAPDLDQDDPPVACKLTDLSPGGSYLETVAPFPVHTKVILSATVAANQVRVEAMVRVSNPEIGMGLAFLQDSSAQRDQLNKFIQALISSEGALPEIMVQPEGLETPEKAESGATIADPLLDLFRQKSTLDSQSFLLELRKQRGPSSEEAASVQ